jgi:hypothetical protein
MSSCHAADHAPPTKQIKQNIDFFDRILDESALLA